MLSGDRDAVSSVFVEASIARQMSDMIRAFRISQIVGTIAQLGIPDRLASGARTAGELASLIGCHAGATHRLMRAASDLGLVASGSDARFTLTALGQSLRSDVPGSVRDSAIALTSPGHWLPWGRLSVAVRTGRRQTVETLGAELFEYYSDKSCRRSRIHRSNDCVQPGGGGRSRARSRYIFSEACGGCRWSVRRVDFKPLDEKSGAHGSYIGTPRGRAARPSCRS